MINNAKTISSIPTGQTINSNGYYIKDATGKIYFVRNANNVKKNNNNKKVNFNTNVTIYDVESYKEHNKKYCYNVNEEDYQYLNNDDKYKENINKYLNKFKKNNNYTVQNKVEKSDCCCIIT